MEPSSCLLWNKNSSKCCNENVERVRSVCKRRSRHLKRRRYKSGEPNNTCDADGDDKLKPYGLPIHGAVDGFSRKILWLKVRRSNNNLINPPCFFVEVVKEFGFSPSLLRTDAGTENV